MILPWLVQDIPRLPLAGHFFKSVYLSGRGQSWYKEADCPVEMPGVILVQLFSPMHENPPQHRMQMWGMGVMPDYPLLDPVTR